MQAGSRKLFFDLTLTILRWLLGWFRELLAQRSHHLVAAQ